MRWHRPGGGLLLRLAAVAVLLVTAAATLWSRPQSCTVQTGAENSAPTAKAATSPANDAEPMPPGVPGAPPPVPAGRVGVPIRLADPTALSLVRMGNHVDLLRLGDSTRGTTSVASSALVLNVTGADDPTTGGLLLALTPAEAEQAVVTTGHGFAVLIRPG
ncbi:hypothetical protein ACWKSP_24190 [Micromonosporaceae bacterium Da 78-11]